MALINIDRFFRRVEHATEKNKIALLRSAALRLTVRCRHHEKASIICRNVAGIRSCQELFKRNKWLVSVRKEWLLEGIQLKSVCPGEGSHQQDICLILGHYVHDSRLHFRSLERNRAWMMETR